MRRCGTLRSTAASWSTWPLQVCPCSSALFSECLTSPSVRVHHPCKGVRLGGNQLTCRCLACMARAVVAWAGRRCVQIWQLDTAAPVQCTALSLAAPPLHLTRRRLAARDRRGSDVPCGPDCHHSGARLGGRRTSGPSAARLPSPADQPGHEPHRCHRWRGEEGMHAVSFCKAGMGFKG